jgi:hypothetical protein
MPYIVASWNRNQRDFAFNRPKTLTSVKCSEQLTLWMDAMDQHGASRLLGGGGGGGLLLDLAVFMWLWTDTLGDQPAPSMVDLLKDALIQIKAFLATLANLDDEKFAMATASGTAVKRAGEEVDSGRAGRRTRVK